MAWRPFQNSYMSYQKPAVNSAHASLRILGYRLERRHLYLNHQYARANVHFMNVVMNHIGRPIKQSAWPDSAFALLAGGSRKAASKYLGQRRPFRWGHHGAAHISLIRRCPRMGPPCLQLATTHDAAKAKYSGK